MSQERVVLRDYDLVARTAVVNGEPWKAVSVDGREYVIHPDFMGSVSPRREVERRDGSYLALRVDRVGDKVEGIPITGHNSKRSLKSAMQREIAKHEMRARLLAYIAKQG